jgi:excisionase family DNA binding protein
MASAPKSPTRPGSGPVSFDPSERFLTVGTVAEYFGVTEVTIKNWVDGGQLLAARTVGGHRRIAASSIVRLLETQGRAVPATLARRKPAVVLVDGDPAIARVIRRVVAQRARLETATDDYTALLMVARMRPEVLVVDAQLPGLDLRKLVSALRAEPATREVQILAVGAAAAEQKQQGPPSSRPGGGVVFLRRGDSTAISEAILSRITRSPAASRRR